MNWKDKAKDLIAQAKIIEAIEVIEANGVKTGNLLSQVQELEAETHIAKFSEISWALLQKINGTNKPMPEYLK